MGWKPEVLVDGKWGRNALVFATEAEALASARDLMDRWMNVTEARAVEVVGEPAKHSYLDGELRLLPLFPDLEQPSDDAPDDGADS